MFLGHSVNWSSETRLFFVDSQSHCMLKMIVCELKSWLTFTKSKIHLVDNSPKILQFSKFSERFLRFEPMFILTLFKSFKLLLLLKRKIRFQPRELLSLSIRHYLLLLLLLFVLTTLRTFKTVLIVMAAKAMNWKGETVEGFGHFSSL